MTIVILTGELGSIALCHPGFLFTSLMVRGGISFFAIVAVLQSFVPTSFLLTLSHAHPTSLQVTVPAGHVPTPQGTPTLSSLQYFAVPRGDQSQQLNTSTGIKYWKLARIANFRYFHTHTHSNYVRRCIGE